MRDVFRRYFISINLGRSLTWDGKRIIKLDVHFRCRLQLRISSYLFRSLWKIHESFRHISFVSSRQFFRLSSCDDFRDQGGRSVKVVVCVYCFGAHCSGWQHFLMALSLISAPDITSFTPQAICPFPYWRFTFKLSLVKRSHLVLVSPFHCIVQPPSTYPISVPHLIPISSKEHILLLVGKHCVTSLRYCGKRQGRLTWIILEKCLQMERKNRARNETL